MKKNFGLRYCPFSSWISRKSGHAGLAHGKISRNPNTTGRNSSTITHIDREAAPSGRRIISPHCPPVTYCSISTASDPPTMENQNSQLGSQER